MKMSSSRLKSRRRNDQGSKLARIIIAILSTIGVIDTGSITLQRWGIIGSLSCPGGVEGCDKVLNSAWGTILATNNYQIPLSFIGFISYLTILTLAIIPFLAALIDQNNNLSRQSWFGLFVLSNSMAIFSLLLIGIMVFKIEAFCFFCILSGFLSILIFLLTIFGGAWEDPRQMIFRSFLISIVVLLAGLIWSSSVDPSKSKNQLNSQGVAPPLVLAQSTPSSIALAKHLTTIGATQYSAYWCPHCHDQKELFGKEAASKLLIVECAADGLNSQTKLCKEKGITGFPSWEINGQIDSGVKSLDELADISNYKGSRDF